MRLFFNQNPQFFFVTLVIIIVLMLVYILLQHSKINELMVLLNIKTASVDQTDSRFLTDDDLAPASVVAEQNAAVMSKVMSIDVSGQAEKHKHFSQRIQNTDMHRIPNPATFNAEFEASSGGGQT